MKKILPTAFLILLFLSCKDKPAAEVAEGLKFRTGDIIFQTSKSEQSEAIQKATNSRYSHVGVLFKDSTDFYVLEAVQPVKFTKLEDWVKNGNKQHYVVKRLRQKVSIISDKDILKMRSLGQTYLGKNYDTYFEWSNRSFYSSELVWKLYKRSLNIELCRTKKLEDFNITDPMVATKLKERYGKKLPLKQKVVSPADIYNSELLELIYKN